MAKSNRGPLLFIRWRATENTPEWETIHEFPLFASADFAYHGHIELGPYTLIGIIQDMTDRNRPALMLRVKTLRDFHLREFDRIDTTSFDDYHGGDEADELAALISLCLGVRIKAGSATRMFHKGSDPLGTPVGGFDTRDPLITHTLPLRNRPIIPRALDSKNISNAVPFLLTIPSLTEKDASALVRAARMYQEAIWVSETTPELSWILFSSAIETVAAEWRPNRRTQAERSKTELADHGDKIEECGKTEVVEADAGLLETHRGPTKRFTEFIASFLPEPPPNRPLEYQQVRWERNLLKSSMKKIYDYRSRALHDGTPFPYPMCEPPFKVPNEDYSEIPQGLGTSAKGGTWVLKDTPMLLHTYEYIVRNAILKWWKSVIPPEA